MNHDLAGLIAGIIQSACRQRAGRSNDVLICSSCVFAEVEVPQLSEYGLCDAIRLLVTKRAHRSLGWPKSESVLAKHSRTRELHAAGELVAIRKRLSQIVKL